GVAAGAEPLRQPHLLVHGRRQHELQPRLHQERAVDLGRPDLRLLIGEGSMKTTHALMLGAALAALGGQTMAQTAERPLRPEPAPVQASDRPVVPPTEQPERIILNLTADPAHEMAITWRTAPGVVGFVEY